MAFLNQGYQGIPVAQTEECCTSNKAMGSIPSESINWLKCISWLQCKLFQIKVPACQMHKCKNTVYHRPKKQQKLIIFFTVVHMTCALYSNNSEVIL